MLHVRSPSLGLLARVQPLFGLQKLALTSIVIFLPPSVQLPFAMCALFVYTAALLLQMPYLRKSDDRLALLAQSELFLIAQAGYIILIQGTIVLDPATNLVLSAALILLSIAVFLAFIGLAAYNIKKQFWDKRQRAKPGQMKKSIGGEDDMEMVRMRVESVFRQTTPANRNALALREAEQPSSSAPSSPAASRELQSSETEQVLSETG